MIPLSSTLFSLISRETQLNNDKYIILRKKYKYLFKKQLQYLRLIFGIKYTNDTMLYS